ncbi:amidohydrolase [Georgenia thermotolerans]|uniref:Amidohydrolase family protein n=1 Tax=Georgenia thermotolerans TaxID=527326 RepID=A0A7J5UR41_9MICO|nr:amidohydrolase [Georgenia thermotolerans]KAE8764912.1 amidohydrolase family protein [Georgenia thermotolerans]
MAADWVFTSGRIFDGRRVHPTATAVAVTGGRIVAVGADAEVRSAAGPAAEHVDLAGRLLTPGFTDAHIHAGQGGIERLGCDLTAVTGGAEAVVAHVRDYARRSGEEWITGGGWSMADFPGGTPTADLLDAVVPDRPVFLVNRDHHGAWVNTAALRRAGITGATADPADGRIERDAHGEPSGTLHEGAMDLVAALLPAETPEQQRAGLLEAQRYLHAHGVTGWQEAIVGDYAGHRDIGPAYRALAREGLLTGRATGALWVPRSTALETVDDVVAELIERRRANGAGGFPSVSAKIMIDGVAENRTAAMLEPYRCACASGHADGGLGLTYLGRDVLLRVAAALDRAGFDLHMHAIGDRAVRYGLDAVERLRAQGGGSTGRHHLAHVQVVDPDDVARFAALGVTVNAQALWACYDDQMAELTVPLLGAERTGHQYPFASLLAAGARLAMGSDWPVSSPDPWQAIHVAVTRRPPAEPDAEPLLPGQALSLRAALAAYTAGSAWLNRLGDGGAVEPGRLADLVVLSTDPFELDPADLHTVGTDLTLVGGRAVHVTDRQGAFA